MIDPVTYYAPLVSGLTIYVTLLLKLIELLGKKHEVEDFMKRLPRLLRLLAKSLIYFLTLAIPNVLMIWFFFFQAGISPDRLSEVNFFWAVVAQPTLGVSIYAYIWAKLIYPGLRNLLGETKLQPEPPSEPQPEAHPKPRPKRRSKSRRKPRQSGASSKSGAKK